MTAVVGVLALGAVVGSVIPAVDAFLSWLMAWVLGVGLGAPAAWWVVKRVADEIGSAGGGRPSRPRVESVAQPDVEPVEEKQL